MNHRLPSRQPACDHHGLDDSGSLRRMTDMAADLVENFGNRTDGELAVTQDYDIAVSFAAEQRDYVERTVTAAQAMMLKVFYDRDMSNMWWGRNFIVEQRKVYKQRALHFVPFISTEYLARPYPRDEFFYAMLRIVEGEGRYILPVLVGEVVVPPELLHPYIGYLRAEEHTPEQLAAHMKVVVADSRSRSPERCNRTGVRYLE